MLTTSIDDTVHPTCEPKPTAVDIQCAEFLAAVQAGDDARADELAAIIDAAERPTLRGSALYYSQTLGWPVFPLRAGTKEPATRNGFQDASTDRRRVEAWWNANPNYNIGLPTGHVFDVIDVDPAHGGWQSLAQLDEGDVLPDIHGRVATAGGDDRLCGVHLYIAPTGDKNGTNLMPGIDYRGLGGYVVGAPSRLSGGRGWSWSSPPSPRVRRVATHLGLAG